MTKIGRTHQGLRAAAGRTRRPPCDVDALATLSRFAHARAEDFSSVEINPLLALPDGQGAMALDAVVIRGTTSV